MNNHVHKSTQWLISNHVSTRKVVTNLASYTCTSWWPVISECKYVEYLSGGHNMIHYKLAPAPVCWFTHARCDLYLPNASVQRESLSLFFKQSEYRAWLDARQENIMTATKIWICPRVFSRFVHGLLLWWQRQKATTSTVAKSKLFLRTSS